MKPTSFILSPKFVIKTTRFFLFTFVLVKPTTLLLSRRIFFIKPGWFLWKRKYFTDQNEVVVSSIITRGDDLNDKAQEVNEILYSHCNDYGITYLDNSNIEKYNLTYRGRFPGLHLNKSGSDILLSNFVDFINMWCVTA